VALDAVYRNAAEALVDPVTPLVDILDPTNTVIVTGAVPVRSSLGLYDYPGGGYLVPANAAYGVWTARWTGTVAGTAYEALDEFEVVSAVVPTASGAFATVADLATFLQRDLSAADTATAALVLDLASGAIRDYTGQTISLVSNDVVTLDPPQGSRLFLPELPVASVASVVLNGTTLTVATANTSGYYVYGDTGIIQYGYGYGYRNGSWGGAWGWAPRSVVVTYSHGYATIPAAVRMVTLEVAAAMMGSGPDAGLESETIGNYSYTRAAAGQAVADIAGGRLDSYRPLVIA